MLLTGDRAVLMGVDRASSRTVDQVDLGAGLPAWAAPFVPLGEDGRPTDWWGFAL